MDEPENPTNIPAENACNIGAKVFIPGLCPECGAEVKIEWKKCAECENLLG
ncbi:MAG TPA: hypothetical protein QF529_05315 [Candidatus Thalassarchaeaceae archaeon]|jgi:hypothetical protein|nr:hypothetical protein [Candidatus Thalassarchaeaceae archaeon]